MVNYVLHITHLRVLFLSQLTLAVVVAQAASAATLPHPAAVRAGSVGGGSVTRTLHTIAMIGSAVDAQNGDQNPYGLAIAPSTNGAITQGDLVICNFNDNLNIQGLGTTIEVLHPIAGSQPQRLVQDERLTGCASLALGPSDDPWASAFIANDEPIYDSSGNFESALSGNDFAQPWGQMFSATKGPFGIAAFYESNAGDGSIVRIAITAKGRFVPEEIATGFSVNHGVPGTALAPSGLSYNPENDTLYIVDGNVNQVVAFHHVSEIPRHGIVVKGDHFGGIAAKAASVVYSGSPLAAPISAALLFNGNLVVGNTSNNRLVEIDPSAHKVVNTVNLDSGAPGALFGIAVAGNSAANTQIFFNDDNANAVWVLQH
jgi:hypothetical protein